MNCRLLLFLITSFFTTICSYALNPYISIRSQSVDAARDLVGWTDKINLFDMENLYVTGAVTLEGTRSFDSDALSHCLFGLSRRSDSNSDQLFVDVTGSAVPNRNATDWLADYFGLPPTFQSRLVFKPRVSNFIIDFSFYVGLDEFLSGLYFRAHAPVVVTRWGLGFDEEPLPNSLPPAGYPAGYFSPTPVPVANLLNTASEFFSDEDVPTLPDGITFEPLAFARFEQARLHKTALAEIQMALGYNFILCPCYHLGFNFRVYAPTGNRPHGIFAFEPICGNGKHWEVGGGFTSHYTFWESDDEESSFGLYVDGNFTHLCNATQTRTFDLVGKPNSRYMLAERLGTPVQNLFANPVQGTALGSTVPAAQFKNAYAPVANLTSLKVKVSAAVQADIVALLDYTSCGLSVDVGYNFWARSCEKIIIKKGQGPTRLESGNVWALKGDANVYGFAASNAVTPPPAGAGIPLSATQSTATINAGTNGGDPQNPGVDNAEFAMFTALNNLDQIVISPGDPAGAATQQRTSNDPVFLSNADIDLTGSKGMTHKIFAHLSYTWQECEDIVPYIGIGGKAEFGPRHGEPKCTSGSACTLVNIEPIQPCTDCTSCKNCALSEWGVWIKGGIFWS